MYFINLTLSMTQFSSNCTLVNQKDPLLLTIIIKLFRIVTFEELGIKPKTASLEQFYSSTTTN